METRHYLRLINRILVGQWKNRQEYGEQFWDDSYASIIEERLASMNPRYAEIIKRVAVGDTLTELAKEQNISHERMRQLERAGLIRLKLPRGVLLIGRLIADTWLCEPQKTIIGAIQCRRCGQENPLPFTPCPIKKHVNRHGW